MLLALTQETVQILGREFSKGVFELLILLTGIIVGSGISYFISRSLDNRRWKRDRQLKAEEERRKAIDVALEWFLPITLTLSHIESFKAAFQEGTITEEQLHNNTRNLIAKICLIKLLPSSALHFPKDVFHKAVELTKISERLMPGDKYNGPRKDYVEWAESIFEKEEFEEKVKELYDYLTMERALTLVVKPPFLKRLFSRNRKRPAISS